MSINGRSTVSKTVDGGSSPSVPMIFVAIGISFSFLKAPVVRWVLFFHLLFMYIFV